MTCPIAGVSQRVRPIAAYDFTLFGRKDLEIARDGFHVFRRKQVGDFLHHAALGALVSSLEHTQLLHKIVGVLSCEPREGRIALSFRAVAG